MSASFINLMKQVTSPQYSYVSPCPRCGSARTGYLLKTSNTCIGKIHLEKARKGELVKCVSSMDVLSNNSFCADCGLEWMSRIEKIPRTAELVERERANRGVSENYEKDFVATHTLSEKEIRANKKSKKNKRKNPVSRFIGKCLVSNIPFYNEIKETTVHNRNKKRILKEFEEEYENDE